MCGMLASFILSTRPNSVGTITANSFTQLETRTWATIQTWLRRCITSHWFDISGTRISRIGAKERWFCSPQTCREENSESFAGQQAAASTSWYLFDEASNVPTIIYEVADGGLSSGEPMIFAFGNPTRNSGEFHSICFGSLKGRWKSKSIDSRECRFTNKEKIADDLAVWGEDSDRFRVRVRGLPPSKGDLQFISSSDVYDAQKRIPSMLIDDPLIAGVDVGDGGSAWTVVRFRRGFDARSIAPIRIPGEFARDRGFLVGKLAEVLRDHRPERKVSMMFIDSAFGAALYERLRGMGFRNVEEIRFGGKSIDPHQANQRAYMWNRMKDWLGNGAIPAKDVDLESQLTGPGFHINRQDQLVIESKEDMAKRGLASPDDADALALTFARPVRPPSPKIEAAHVEVGRWS